MTQAPWRSLVARALHKNKSLAYSRYAQLATVTPAGAPANRTIVFRGFAPDSDHLQFITDRRSQKIDHIQHQAIAELCWYFPKSREQFRISGAIVLIQQDCQDGALLKLRKQLWHNLSDQGRVQFAWPNPKQQREPSSSKAFTLDAPDRLQPLDNFCAVLLQPHQVDHLQLRGNPQDRCLYSLIDGQWQQQNVNP